MTYTLAQVSRITDMPKSTIQKYYPNDEDSDQFHKKRRQFTSDDLENLIFIKLNLAIGKRKTFIINALKSDAKTKKKIMKEGIESLQNCINLASIYCEDTAGEIIIQNQIQKYGMPVALDFSDILSRTYKKRDSFKSRFFKEQKKCEKKVSEYLSLLFDMADEKKNDEVIENNLNELDKILIKFRPTDYSIRQWYDSLIAYLKFDKELSNRDYLIDCINKHINKYRSESQVYDEKLMYLYNAIHKNNISSNEVQNLMNELMMVYYDEGYTEEDAYYLVNESINFATSEKMTKKMNEKERNIALKFKKANEIFQMNYLKSKNKI